MRPLDGYLFSLLWPPKNGTFSTRLEYECWRSPMSPTRTYAPIVKKLLEEDRDAIHGMVHCSGGGQTKCLRFGTSVHIIKDNFLPIPPIFKAIRRQVAQVMKRCSESTIWGTAWKFTANQKGSSNHR